MRMLARRGVYLFPRRTEAAVPTDAQFNARIDEDRLRAGKRSHRSNFYQCWLDGTLTILERREGLYGYWLSPRKGPPRFSPGAV
jgi:hypothetical protein